MPRANKKKNEQEKCEEKTAQNLLAREFHCYWLKSFGSML
jgi:hypothetical protein